MSHLLSSQGGNFLRHSDGSISRSDEASKQSQNSEKLWAAQEPRHDLVPQKQQYPISSSQQQQQQRSPVRQPAPVQAARTAPVISSNYQEFVFKPPQQQLQQQPSNPTYNDICIGNENHSGNHEFRRIVQDCIIQELYHNQQNAALPKFTPTNYMAIVNQVKERGTHVQFFIVDSLQQQSAIFRLATTKEKIDYVRKCYDATAAAAEATLTAPITAECRPR